MQYGKHIASEKLKDSPMSIRTAILSLKAKPRRRRVDYRDIDPSDIDPDTNEPYDNYESPCIEPHPFGGGISAADY